MSEGVRKNLRTQGKYNDVKIQKNRDKKQKSSISAKDTSETRYPKRNSGGSKGMNNSLSDEGASPLKYEDTSDYYTFRELEKVAKPEEIKGRGKMILSKTVNGDSIMFFEPHFLQDDEGDEYFDHLMDTIHFDSRNIVIHGVEYPQPRLVAWFGPFEYKYSGTTLEPAEMPEVVLKIKEKVERLLKSQSMEASFNSVLINLYRDGKDSVAWHSDDELMLGITPTIASVSLGETRKFEIRPKIRGYDGQSPDNSSKYVVYLTHGSLVVMTGCMQEDWQHRVPKEYHDKGPRINLTFRTVYPLEKAAEFAPAKRFNRETGKSQPCEYNSSRKLSNSKYKLDDENFPSLQKVVVSAKSNVTGNMNDNLKSNFKKDDADEKSWDSEISDIEQTVDDGVSHKNSYPVCAKKDEDFKPKIYEKIRFDKEKISGNWHSTEPYCGNEKNPLDDKTATKRLWCEDYDSSASGFQENNTVKERYNTNYSKSVPNPSANESERNKLYKKIDLRTVYDTEASLTDKSFQQNIASQEECSVKSAVKTNSRTNSTEENNIESHEPPNVCCAGESNTRVGSSEECNLDMKRTTYMPLNVDARAFTNSCITQENNDLDNKKLPNTCQSYSPLIPREEDISRLKQCKKTTLNADAKEFVPSNIKSNNEFSELNLEDLIRYDLDSLQGKDLQDHVKYLKIRITEKIQELLRHDRQDIGFLMEISDGTQSDKNQRLITTQMYRFVQNKLLTTYTPPSFDRSSRQRGYESQNYNSDRGKRFPNHNRNSKPNRNRF